jgi:hypothetical protein
MHGSAPGEVNSLGGVLAQGLAGRDGADILTQ